MPSVGRFPCETCEYVATNRRMLSRHVVVAHSDKVYKCPVCPFITRYAANWYRHKRDLHGLTKTTTCEVCGFFANSTEELGHHTESEHPEHLQRRKFEDKYTRERQRLGAEADPSSSVIPDDKEISGGVRDVSLTKGGESSVNDINSDFFVEDVVAADDSVKFSLPLNGGFLENDLSFAENKTKQTDSVSFGKMETLNHDYGDLSPPKIRRSYCCNLCGLLTSNPREFLYHQRNVHNMRVNVFECKLCIYASKHVQKLQRHYSLVHRQKMPPDEKSQPVSKITKNKKPVTKPDFIVEEEPSFSNNADAVSSYDFQDEDPPWPAPLRAEKRKRINPAVLKCSACSYQTKNKFLLIHHEKTVHLKKKFYRCLQCGYVTNEKARYTKHIKYHNLPKMQCEFCHFKSAYKWNMERHMKNHAMGREGEFNCTLCSFITHSKQSLKMHVANHHHPEDSANEDKQDGSFLENNSCEPNTDSNEFDWTNSFQPESTEHSSLEFSTPNSENVSSQVEDRPSMTWSQETSSPKLLQCSSCNYQTKWSFQLRKHEEIHKIKRHSCPLCGMRFEHIAWLTKHLNRIHKEDSQAKNIAAAFELLKPNRRRPSRSISSPSVSPDKDVIKPVEPRSDKSSTEKQSVLSSLLRSSGPPRYASILPKPEMSSKFKHPSSEPSIKEQNEVFESQTFLPSKKKATCCRVCGYRTKWISELEKHMRVHSDEKPFRCSRCSYHSKWKGDLTRHMMKHHGVKLPMGTRKIPVPKIRLKKALPNRLVSTNRWQTVKQDTDSAVSVQPPTEGKEQESPLDLTVCKSNIFLPSHVSMLKENSKEVNGAMDLRRETRNSNGATDSDTSSVSSKSILSASSTNSHSIFSKETKLDDDEFAVLSSKKKYYCPFCTFTTSTPSRFHVHIVQHYNKKPFMCSLCGYRSNWEWDITKHIRLRGCKDKEHNSACVLLTDETGRRNYEKYDKYLKKDSKTSMHSKLCKPKDSSHKTQTLTGVQDSHATAKDYPKEVASTNCSTVDETPVNIVVTPDITFADDGIEQLDMTNYAMQFNSAEENTESPNNGFKFYLCKHCNYKHSSRKVVISHLSVHAGVRPFRCRVCGLTANWRHIIVRHVKVAHNGYMNDVEDRITYTQEGFVIRITSVRNGSRSSDMASSSATSQYTCKFCPYKCDKEVYIKFHMKQHKPREGAIYQCSFCPYYVKFKKTLVRHLKLHEPPRANFVDDFPDNENDLFSENQDFTLQANCDENFSAETNNYANYASGDTQMEYSDEDSIAVNYNQLNSPDVNLYDPVAKFKRHTCEHCPYRTDNRTQYLYHKQFHRPNSSAPFKCVLCSYWATMQHLLTQHMKVHRMNDVEKGGSPSAEVPASSEMPPPSAYQQQYVPSQSGDSNEIPMVLVQRGGIVTKMFKCRFCPMMNKKRANVRVHERMHGATQNVGKYTCSLCNYKCLGQGSLTNHMKIHQNHDYQINSVQPQPSTEQTPVGANGSSSSSYRKKVFSYFCMRCPAVFKSSSDLYIHRTFHGSNLPFPCPHCDYRAKHKPHLQKHLQVHTLAYVSKRDASFGPPVNPDYDNATEFLDAGDKSSPTNKRIDQMLLLEAAEIKLFLKRGKEFAEKRMHKCPLCPAYFSKTTVLAYHCSLHGSAGEFCCNQCDYATVRSANLSIHSQVHTKTDGVIKRPSRVLQCPKCPASFTKTDRYEKHLGLHGKNFRYVCDMCDYSVRFAANLSKHKFVHYNAEKDGENARSETVKNNATQNLDATVSKFMSPDKQQNDNFKTPEVGEEKKIFICDRCPYFQGRKDAVQSHQQRHFQKEGYQCPYCDYRSLGSSFLRDHVKSHIQPNNLFLPQTYMKYERFKIWRVDGDSRELLFEDKGVKLDCTNRFYPPLKKKEDLIITAPSVSDVGESSHSKTKPSDNKTSKEQASLPKPPPPSEDSRDSTKGNNSVQSHLTPKVVLTDIFSQGDAIKKLENGSLIINAQNMKQLQPTPEVKNKSEPAVSTYSVNNQDTKKPSTHEKGKTKSSIIVKIRVENIVEDNNERSLYTISSKKSNKTESSSDAASDVTIPADDIDDLSPSYDPMQCTAHDENNGYCETVDGMESNSESNLSKEAEPICQTNSDSLTNTPINTENSIDGNMGSKFQVESDETDFLKKLDFMVNSVTMNSSKHKPEQSSSDLQPAVLL